MRLFCLSLLLFLVSCSSDKAQDVQGTSPKPSSKTQVVSDEVYTPIDDGLAVIVPKKEIQKKDQLEVILQNHLLNFPFYFDEDPKDYESRLAESYRKTKDELDSYYVANLNAIESTVTDRTLEERMSLKEYISLRYITVQSKLAKEFINYFFDYKKNYSLMLLNVKAFDNKLLDVCGFKAADPMSGIEDADDLIDEELDAYDNVSKRSLQEHWGDTTYVDSKGLKSITLSEALVIADKLEDLREDIYDHTHCTNFISTAQKLYSYLLSSDASVFKTKYLTRDPQKAEQQANFISEYVRTIIKLVSVKGYDYKIQGKLAKQHSKIFEAKMILYGPWAERSVILETLKPPIFISMAEKFLEGSNFSDEKFYTNIRCNMHQFNHFDIQDDGPAYRQPITFIPINLHCD